MSQDPAPPFSVPYYAVIFVSTQTGVDTEDYGRMSERMMTLAARQPGYLGIDTARSDDGLGITVSYWRDKDAIAAWKAEAEHLEAQKLGRQKWYASFTLHVARVERAYAMERDGGGKE